MFNSVKCHEIISFMLACNGPSSAIFDFRVHCFAVLSACVSNFLFASEVWHNVPHFLYFSVYHHHVFIKGCSFLHCSFLGVVVRADSVFQLAVVILGLPADLHF